MADNTVWFTSQEELEEYLDKTHPGYTKNYFSGDGTYGYFDGPVCVEKYPKELGFWYPRTQRGYAGGE